MQLLVTFSIALCLYPHCCMSLTLSQSFCLSDTFSLWPVFNPCLYALSNSLQSVLVYPTHLNLFLTLSVKLSVIHKPKHHNIIHSPFIGFFAFLWMSLKLFFNSSLPFSLNALSRSPNVAFTFNTNHVFFHLFVSYFFIDSFFIAIIPSIT